MTKVTRLTINDGSGAQNRRIHLREISGDMDAPLETVGQDLRAARLRRGDDLASVSRVLKIRREHLEALEEDRLEALPGRTYAVGFVRSYAEYLGLDAAHFVERFKAEIAGRSDSGTTVHVIEEDEHRRLPQGWMIIAGVVVLLLAYGAYRLVVAANELLTQPVTPAPPHAARVVKPSPSTPDRNASTVPPTITANGYGAANSLTAPSNGQSIEPLPPSRPASGASEAGTISTQPLAAPDNQLQALPPGEVYGGQNHNPRVILRVHTATRILVQGPKRTVFINRTLKPGDTYQVPNMVGLTLTTPNGGAVELDLDGAAMGFAGQNQQMTEALSLDPQAIVDRYNGSRG